MRPSNFHCTVRQSRTVAFKPKPSNYILQLYGRMTISNTAMIPTRLLEESTLPPVN